MDIEERNVLVIGADKEYYSAVRASKDSMTVSAFRDLLSDYGNMPVILSSDRGFLFGGISDNKFATKDNLVGIAVDRDYTSGYEASFDTFTADELSEKMNTYDGSFKVVFIHDNGYTYGALNKKYFGVESLADDSIEDEEDYSEYDYLYESTSDADFGDFISRFKDWDSFANWFKNYFGEEDFRKLNLLIDKLDSAEVKFHESYSYEDDIRHPQEMLASYIRNYVRNKNDRRTYGQMLDRVAQCLFGLAEADSNLRCEWDEYDSDTDDLIRHVVALPYYYDTDFVGWLFRARFTANEVRRMTDDDLFFCLRDFTESKIDKYIDDEGYVCSRLEAMHYNGKQVSVSTGDYEED